MELQSDLLFARTCDNRFPTPEEMLRTQFVDGVLPSVGDQVIQVVHDIDPKNGWVSLKYKVIKSQDDQILQSGSDRSSLVDQSV